MPTGDANGLTVEARAGSRVRRLSIGGHVFLTTSKDVVAALDLSDDDPDPKGIAARVAELEPACAYNRGLYLLGYRERSEHELHSRLMADGYSQRSIDSTLARLIDHGLLDDSRFAEHFIRSKTAAGWGPRRITQGLRASGVDAETIERSVPAESEDDTLERAIGLARVRPPRTDADVRRLVSRLVRRGYSYSIARAAADAARDGATPS